VKRLAILACLLAGLAVVVSACGSKEASIVDRAFQQHINSAQMTLRMSFQQGAHKAQAFELTGPFKSNGDNQLPSFDFKVNAADQLKGEAISSGKNVFVRYEGQTYEVGADKIAEFQRKMAAKQDKKDQVNSLADAQRLGLDLKSWFPQTSVKQDARAAGVDTTRVSGRLDIDKALRDFAKLLARPEFKAQMHGAQISEDQLRALGALVSDPRFKLDVGRQDGKLRQITAQARIKGQGKLSFLLVLRDVDKPVTIDAPSSGRPIEELLRRFGGGTAGSDTRKLQGA